ncbi:hypothetical protein LJC13_01400 [Peptostreptococcaceae bacterium OttesenSCG-928-C18]|nr:hypothetical protein [Peptostreptococcaceae bacterium OttesenSCG-928-C18]
METTQIFQIILYVSLSILAVAFVVFLIKLISTISKVNGIIEKNRTEIDITMRKLPEVMGNVEGITKKADVLIGDVSPDVKNIVSNTNKTMANVENIVEDVTGTVEEITHTVDHVTETVADTADSIKNNILGYGDYIGYIIEIINYIKSKIKR